MTYDHYTQRQLNSCLHCAKPSCARGCPLNNDISTFLQAVKVGNHDVATSVINHPFGAVCGSICHASSQCVGSCALNAKQNAVDVCKVEQQFFLQNPYVFTKTDNDLGGKRIAVVGGGVAGVTFACQAYKHGADVTIFEQDRLLSTLRLIPNFRLPSKAVDDIVSQVQKTCKVVQQKVDGDALSQLQRNFDVVLLATGQSVLRPLGVKGQQFATDYRRFLSGEIVGNNVVVVGGGNTACDCARLAKSKGCNVTVVYRRSKQEMPAFAEEVSLAQQEGVNFVFNVCPTQLTKDGETLTLTLAQTLSQDRGKLTVTSQTQNVQCSQVVSATGGNADLSLVGGSLQAQSNLQVGNNLFVAGDFCGGTLAVHAVRDALQISKYLLNEN